MLKDIIFDVASHIGLDPSTKRNYLVTLINQGANELYQMIDTVGSMREQVFSIDTTLSLVTLPWYVGEFRAARAFNSGQNITVHDMAPRYASSGWREQFNQNALVWRHKGNTAVEDVGNNSGILTITLSGKESKAVKLTITGGNEDQARFQETVIIAAGDLTTQTINHFDPSMIESISKDALTDFDLVITDLDNVQIAFIPNCEYISRYQLIQISDFTRTFSTPNQYVETIYKARLTPFRYDTDLFVGGTEKYDKAIYWKTIELWASKKQGKEDLVKMAFLACDVSVHKIAADADAGIDKQIDFGPNPYLNLLPRPTAAFTRRFRMP